MFSEWYPALFLVQQDAEYISLVYFALVVLCRLLSRKTDFLRLLKAHDAFTILSLTSLSSRPGADMVEPR